jgi:hypothetical protein
VKARAQCVHQVHFLLRLLDLRGRDLLSSLLALDQVSKRVLIPVLELLRLNPLLKSLCFFGFKAGV